MKFEIGKVRTFNGYSGTIISKSGSYMFLDKDIINGSHIEINDYVIFRAEKSKNFNHAYFVQFLTKEINNVSEVGYKLSKILKKEDDSVC